MSRGSPPLLVGLLMAIALAGCVQGDEPAGPGDANIDASVPAHGRPGAIVVGPEEGWFQFGAPATTNMFTVEGDFAIQEGFTPAHQVLNMAGQGGAVPQTWRIQDITDQVPANVPVRIQSVLSHDGAGGTWVGGPNEIFWTYDQSGNGDGMKVDALLVRAPDATVGIGVWNGQPQPAPTVGYSVEVKVETFPQWLPAAIVYGVTVGKDQTLEMEFDATPGTGAIWVWDAKDKFLGRLDADGTVLRMDVADPKMRAAAGEWVVFVVEKEPNMRLRVVDMDGARAPAVRVLNQVVATQGPWQVTGGQPFSVTYDVPVAPLQVGFSFQTQEPVLDVQAALHGPDGKMLLSSSVPGASTGLGGFANTDMGIPSLEPGSYELMYSDTQSKSMVLDAWYVTYAR